MRVQIVLDEHDLFGVREHLVGDMLQRVGVVDRRVAFGHERLAPSFERREDHEDAGGSIALILIIDALRPASLHRDGLARSFSGCFVVSSMQTTGRAGSCGR